MSFPTLQKIVLSERQQDYNPQDELTFMVDGNDISLLNGKNSYIRCSVRLSGDAKANLDRNGGGGHSLLERVSIYSGDGATLLEQLEDLPVYMGVRNYFDKTEGLDNMRNLLEGVAPQATSGVAAIKSPYFNGSTLGEANFTWVELCLPLYMSGVLYGDNAFPCIATSGLMIKIQLASAQKAIQTIGSWGDEVNGFVQDRTGNGAVPVASDLPATPGVLATGAVPAGQPSLPSNVGKCFELGADVAAGAATTTIDVATAGAGQPAGIGGGITPANLLPNANAPTEASGEFPYVVGQRFYYLNDVGVIVDCGAITGIATVAAVIRLTFAAFTSTVATIANHNPCWVANANENTSLSYTIRDAQLVCSVVQPESAYFSSMMSRMKSSSGYEMDIKSFNLYRNNLLKSQVKTQQLIPTTEFRARSLLQAQMFPVLTWTGSAYRPISDYLGKYQYNIANRLIPQLPVSTDKEITQNEHNWNAEVDAERIKCLEAAKVDVKSEIHPSAHFVFGREVAKIGHSSNLNTHEVRLTQDWGVVDPNTPALGTILPQKDKLLYTYVRHFRKIAMRPGNVVVSF
tara:strand:- start:6641 stop:8359 length:1719 start_codon:yes stop_codon:yes gene_type:complete